MKVVLAILLALQEKNVTATRPEPTSWRFIDKNSNCSAKALVDRSVLLQLCICRCSLLGLRKKEIREIQKAWEIFATYPDVGTDLALLMMDVVKVNGSKNPEERKEMLKNVEYHDKSGNTTIKAAELLPRIGTVVSELGNDEATAQNLDDISKRYKYSYSKKQLKRLGGRILAVMKRKMKDRLTRAAEAAIRKAFRAAIELMDP